MKSAAMCLLHLLLSSLACADLAKEVVAAPPSLLHPAALRRLSLGSSRPQGWLLEELRLQAKGLTGQLPHFWHYVNKSDWLGTKGSQPEQFVPYYLDGLVPLSYLVEDANLVSIRERYLGYILDQQDANLGWLGPPISNNTGGARNYWGKYPAVKAFILYAEAGSETQKARVTEALVRHHKMFYTALKASDPPLVAGRWAFARSSDDLVAIEWLIDQNRTDPFLLELLNLIRTETDSIMRLHANYSWEDYFEHGNPFPPWEDGEKTGATHLLHHGVDIGEAMKTGALYWRMTGSKRDLQNPAVALSWADRLLHMSDGMYVADETIPPVNTPSRGTETCSVVETMFSMRIAYETTGNVTFMDRLERLAFNSLPAALWDDVTANVYHHCSNQVNANGGHWEYNLFFCCSANVHQGWPKFAMGPVHQAEDGAIVISSFVPTVTALPEGGEIEVQGQYPFADNVTLLVSSSQAITARVRVPCWTKKAVIRVNGGNPIDADSCGFHDVVVPAMPKQRVEIQFLQDIAVHRWGGTETGAPGAAEVHRGPLTFALRPASNVTETLINGSIKKRSVEATGPWNFALDLGTLRFEGGGVVPAMPFSSTEPPAVRIVATGRQVPEWLAGAGHGPQSPPASPVSSSSPMQELELVPFGATNVRISVFPVLDESESASFV